MVFTLFGLGSFVGLNIYLMDLHLFKEQLVVEKMLYGDSPVFEFIEVQKKDFLVNIFGLYPKLRPHHLENFVLFCSHYLQDESFRKIVLKKVFIVCPTLIQRLFRFKCFTNDEIRESLENHKKKFLCLFFKNDFEVDETGFSDRDDQYSHQYCYDQYSQEYCDGQYSQEHWNETKLDSLIQFGFHKSSMEFCLKYDLFEEIESIMINNTDKRECNWSPFEWSEKPKSLDFLSFSGFFGSLKCFRVLLFSGFVINELVVGNVVCSGSRELFNLVSDLHLESFSCLHESSRFVHLSAVEYLVNQKADINARDKNDLTPLHYAAEKGHLSVVEYLVNQKADLNAQASGYQSGTPLHLAVNNGHLSVVEYLVNQNADINAIGYNVEFLYLIRLLFIMLLKMVILVLLNI